MGLAVGYPHKTRDIPTQVDEGVKFDGGFVASELSPGEQRQAEIDGRGIQRVGGMLEWSAEAVGLVQSPRPSDQDPSEVRVVKFPLKGVEADFDVSQALARGQLSEGHAEKLIED